MSLDQAARALEAGDRAAALEALLEAWRACRAPILEEIIDVVSRDLARAASPLEGRGVDYDAAWSALEKAGRVADLERLLPGLSGEPRGGIPLRLRALVARGADPRLGRAALGMIATPPITASSNFSMWTLLFKALPELVDTRARPQLEERARTKGGASQFWPKLTGWIEAALPRLPEPAELPDRERALAEELLTRARELAEGPPAAPEAPPAPSEAGGPSLEEALPRLRARDPEGALEVLRGAWGARRLPGLAELIERLGAHLDERQPPLAGEAKALHTAWMAEASSPPAARVGRLLEALGEGRLVDVEERLAAMLHWPPDPRAMRSMISFANNPHIGGRPLFWRAVYDVMQHNADPRLREAFLERADHLEGRPGWDRVRVERAQARRVREALLTTCALPHDPLPEEQRELADLEAAVSSLVEASAAVGAKGRRTAAELVEAVLAAPGDDTARLVFADWLSERGDPLGEFITLDVALSQGKKVKGKRDKHLKAHLPEILGPLAPIVYSPSWDRGMLDKVQLGYHKAAAGRRPEEVRAMYQDWRWSTVREIATWSSELLDPILAQAPLRSLEALGQVSLFSLARRDPGMGALPLVRLNGNFTEDATSADWEALARVAPNFPALRHLGVTLWGREGEHLTPPLEFFRSPLVQQLAQISNGSGGLLNIHEWLERLEESGCPVERVELLSRDMNAELVRQPDGRRSLALRFARWLRPVDAQFPQVLEDLRQLRPSSLASLSCEFEEGCAARAELEAALAHLPR